MFSCFHVFCCYHDVAIVLIRSHNSKYHNVKLGTYKVQFQNIFHLDLTWVVSLFSVSFYKTPNQPRPAEQVKQAEKSTDAVDVAIAEQRTQSLREWGDLAVWQGCVDVVTKHLGTQTASSRVQRGNKVSKDLKHLST